MIQAYIEHKGKNKEYFMDMSVTDENDKHTGTIIAVDDCDWKGHFIVTIFPVSEFVRKYEALIVKSPTFPCYIGSIA